MDNNTTTRTKIATTTIPINVKISPILLFFFPLIFFPAPKSNSAMVVNTSPSTPKNKFPQARQETPARTRKKIFLRRNDLSSGSSSGTMSESAGLSDEGAGCSVIT